MFDLAAELFGAVAYGHHAQRREAGLQGGRADRRLGFLLQPGQDGRRRALRICLRC